MPYWTMGQTVLWVVVAAVGPIGPAARLQDGLHVGDGLDLFAVAHICVSGSLGVLHACLPQPNILHR
jgi:hypothetical protein